jgi:hypothetical protein
MNTQISILIGILILSTSCSKVDKFEAQTAHMSKTTDSLNGKTGEMLDITKKMLESTTKMAKITENMGETTKGVGSITEKMGDKTDAMAEITKEMLKETKGVAKITAKMGVKTDAMAEITKRMLVETENLKRMARAKEAEETRGRSFKGIESARSFKNKTMEAAVFHKAFEYQLWTNSGEDTPHYREVLMTAAMKEYFRKLEDYAGRITTWDRKWMSPDTKQNERKNVYALAVTLHMTQDYQEEIAKKYEDIKVISILNIFEDTLVKYEEIKNGERNESDLKEYERIVIENEKEVKFLLWARYDMLSAMALNYLGNVKDKNIFGKIGMIVFSWKNKFGQLNFEQQKMTNIFLKECNREKRFLKSIGVKVKLNSSIRKMYKKMKTPSVLKMDKNKCIGCQAKYNELKGHLGELLRK